MGILLNHGELKPTIRISRLRFAGNTPYETTVRHSESTAGRVMPEAAARAILPILANVVQTGTAARLSGAYKTGGRILTVGGKTGSGDNRRDSYGSRGQVLPSRPVDRTAVFVFYIEDRYYGVVTAFVPGKEAGEYGFTSSLPVAILKLLAPDIESLWPGSPKASPKDLILASASSAGATANSQNAGAAGKTGL